MVRLLYDNYLCAKPEACMKCIKACPRGVLMLAPFKKPKSPWEPPCRYIIFAAYTPLCDRCGACVKACPNGALAVK